MTKLNQTIASLSIHEIFISGILQFLDIHCLRTPSTLAEISASLFALSAFSFSLIIIIPAFFFAFFHCSSASFLFFSVSRLASSAVLTPVHAPHFSEIGLLKENKNQKIKRKLKSQPQLLLLKATMNCFRRHQRLTIDAFASTLICNRFNNE